MSDHKDPTADVPLSSAEIAGYMNWRGPGAYSIHAERRIIKIIAEAVRRERQACAAFAEAGIAESDPGAYNNACRNIAAGIRARGQS